MNQVDIRHLPPELHGLVNTIVTGVLALASRANSLGDTNSALNLEFAL